MKIHEYQAKELLKKYHIPIQDGVVCESENQIESSINEVSPQLIQTNLSSKLKYMQEEEVKVVV